MFSAFNCHMKVIFLTHCYCGADFEHEAATLGSVSFRYLIRDLSRSFHRRPIKHNMRHKLKRGPMPPKKQSNALGFGDAISCMFGWGRRQSVTEMSCF